MYFIIIIYLTIIIINRILRYINDKPFYHIEEFAPYLNDIKINYREINTKLKNWKDWIPWSEKDLYEKKNWNILPLFAFNKWIKPFESHFPDLTKQLKEIKTIKTVLFSKMEPNTIIKPHQGWALLSNNIIRCHHGINIPGKSFVGVSNQKRYHQQGKWFAFDDSKLHYAGNLCNKSRIVLIIDIERPSYFPRGVSTISCTNELKTLVNKYLVD